MGTTTIVDVVVPEIENGDEYTDKRKRVLAFLGIRSDFRTICETQY